MSTSPPPSGKDPPTEPISSSAQAPTSPPTIPSPDQPTERRLSSQQEAHTNTASLEPSSSTHNLPRPDFAPFFTLISDSASNSVHHPVNVHYIFSDDDSSALTTACMHTLTPPEPSSTSNSRTSLSSSSNQRASASKADASASTSSGSSAQPRHDKREREREREERFIVLDVNEAGDKVVAAHSLTPKWQLVSTEITKAPTWDGAEEEEVGAAAAQGLMLKIEGTDGRCEEGRGDDVEALQALVESFEAKMRMLRRVVEAGGEREVEEVGN